MLYFLIIFAYYFDYRKHKTLFITTFLHGLIDLSIVAFLSIIIHLVMITLPNYYGAVTSVLITFIISLIFIKKHLRFIKLLISANFLALIFYFIYLISH